MFITIFERGIAVPSFPLQSNVMSGNVTERQKIEFKKVLARAGGAEAIWSPPRSGTMKTYWQKHAGSPNSPTSSSVPVRRSFLGRIASIFRLARRRPVAVARRRICH